MRARKNKSAYERKTGKRWTPHVQYDWATMIDQKLPTDAPRFYFFMHEFPKVGLNPNADYESTPLGVYAYPLTRAYFQKLVNDKLPYVSRAAYTTVLEATQPESMYLFENNSRIMRNLLERLAGRTLTKDEARAFVKTLSPLETEQVDVRGFERYETLNLMRDKYIAIKALRGTTAQFASRLLKEGVTSVVDMGTETIHVNEPHQAVFLSPRAFRVVDTFRTADLRKEGAVPKTSAQLVEDIQALGPAIAGLVVEQVVLSGGQRNDYQTARGDTPWTERPAKDQVNYALGVVLASDILADLLVKRGHRVAHADTRNVMLWAKEVDYKTFPGAGLENSVYKKHFKGPSLSPGAVVPTFAVKTIDAGWVTLRPAAITRDEPLLSKIIQWGDKPPVTLRRMLVSIELGPKIRLHVYGNSKFATGAEVEKELVRVGRQFCKDYKSANPTWAAYRGEYMENTYLFGFTYSESS